MVTSLLNDYNPLKYRQVTFVLMSILMAFAHGIFQLSCETPIFMISCRLVVTLPLSWPSFWANKPPLMIHRAVKKFLSSRLMMNSGRLWNLHQRHKFLRAEEARNILKIQVSEMAFPGFFKRYFPLWTPCCFVRIHVLGTMPSKCPRLSKTSHGSNISEI